MPLSAASTAVLSERFRLVADMNRDGAFTISDIWAWFKFVYFAPGDLIAGVLYGSEAGRFLEINYGSLGGWGSGVVSFFVWLFVLFAGVAIADDVHSRK